ncbi:MAG: hypothetical protein IIA66_07850, partial [Planctomycetes bacterium]|nr:hypothetical protein [Planctomycetota bacterium]
MKLVVFLGAGFSRAFSLPVMSEFFDVSNKSAVLNEEDKQLLVDLRRDTRRATSMLVGPSNNLEHILSFAMMASLDQYNLESPRYRQLCDILRKVYSMLPEGMTD